MSKLFAHDCIRCAGEGTLEEIDHARTHSASEEPVWKVSVCDVCHGDGEIHLDEQAHAFVCDIADDHVAQRVVDRSIITEQRQHIRTLESLLKAERDRVAMLERHINSGTEAQA